MKAYQIKVTVKGAKPPVWRRMIIPAGITFSQFSAMINEAMQWSGYHLYSFEFTKLGLCFEELEDDWNVGFMETLEAREYRIDSYMDIQKSFTYIYDFGDDWKHTVTVEKVIDDYQEDGARVIKFKGNGFPEDCGGIWGYYELLERLEDPNDPEYEMLSEWYENMNPEEYDMDVVNQILRDLEMEGNAKVPDLQEEADVLLVVDMQNDFIDGALGTKEAQEIVAKVDKKIEEFDGVILFTQDTHGENYLDTQEGKNLPVSHCIRGTKGWEIHPVIAKWIEREECVIEKDAFGSPELAAMLTMMSLDVKIKSITLVGLCTDICVISNAILLKSFMPEVPVIVDASCCAGVTPESHENALRAMEVCQVSVENRGTER